MARTGIPEARKGTAEFHDHKNLQRADLRIRPVAGPVANPSGCQAITKAGTKCQAAPRAGERYCSFHR